MLSTFLTVITFSPHSLTKGLCVISKILSKYSLNFIKNSPTISKLSLLTLPNTSSKTVMFGLGREDIFPSTALKANDEIVFYEVKRIL